MLTGRARVLVVDDDTFLRDMLGRLLLQAGMAVQTYASAAAFLEGADLRTPAVLLLDVRMPTMSGLQLHDLLRARGNTLPVVFLTGACGVAMAVAAMRDGAVDFIEKPFDGAELIARVQDAFRVHVLRLGAGAGAQQARQDRQHARERLAHLTPREHEVLDLMVTGRTSKAIARELGCSFRTIEIHRGRVMSKMAVASLADLVRLTIVAERSPS